MKIYLLEDSKADMYLRKSLYVDRLMTDNQEIGVENGLTNEQCEVLVWLCRERHNFHCNMEDLYYDSSSNCSHFVKLFDYEINDNLKSVGLQPIKFSWSVIDDIPTDSMYDIFGFDDWEDAFNDTLDKTHDLNSDIEKYLIQIDSRYGTHYCPTGYARLRR